MDPLDLIDTLAARAAREPVPAIRVNIAAALDAACRERSRLFPLAWSAAASALAACIVLAFSLYTTTSAHASSTASADPVAPLFTPVQVELP